MNILIATDMDNGGQMFALHKALNLYTEHKSRFIVFRESYLDYETDVVDPRIDKVESLVDEADFVILGELPRNTPKSNIIYRKIGPTNTIIRAGGSIARAHYGAYTKGLMSHIIKTGAYHDPTLFRTYPMAHTVNMYHFNDWPVERKADKDKPIKLVFSGTALKHKEGHSGAYAKAWIQLEKKYSSDEVEFINVLEESWDTSLKIKSSCHICFDQLLLGTYASSAIEGMYYHMPTFCFISGWCKSIHPDVPLISDATVNDIVSTTSMLIENPDKRDMIGSAGHEYVMKVHDAKNAVKRWEGLIDFVSSESDGINWSKVQRMFNPIR